MLEIKFYEFEGEDPPKTFSWVNFYKDFIIDFASKMEIGCRLFQNSLEF